MQRLVCCLVREDRTFRYSHRTVRTPSLLFVFFCRFPAAYVSFCSASGVCMAMISALILPTTCVRKTHGVILGHPSTCAYVSSFQKSATAVIRYTLTLQRTKSRLLIYEQHPVSYSDSHRRSFGGGVLDLFAALCENRFSYILCVLQISRYALCPLVLLVEEPLFHWCFTCSCAVLWRFRASCRLRHSN